MESPQTIEDLGCPLNLEAEEAVLGCCMTDGDALAVALERLTPDSFFAPSYREVFAAMTSIHDAGEPLDFVTLFDVLRNRGVYEQVGGATLIARFNSYAGVSSNIRYYVKIVRSKALRRKLIDAAEEIRALAKDEEASDGDVLEQCHSLLPALASIEDDDTESAMRPIMSRVFEEMEARSEAGGKIRGISTGLDGVDYYTSGLKKGCLVVLAGRPSMGKSGAACSIALACAKAGKRVLYFSLEMTREEIGERLLAIEGNLDLLRIQNGTLEEEDWRRAGDAAFEVSELPVVVDDRAGVTAGYVRTKLSRHVKTGGVDLIIIDHFHLMRGKKEPGQTDAAAWGEISRELKAMAKEFKIPVLALAQLNRGVESRTDKRPMMSDLRESGRLEEDADTVIGLYRPSYYAKRDKGVELPEQEEVILDVLKNRNGPTGSVHAMFLAKSARFYDPDVTAIVATVPRLEVVEDEGFGLSSATAHTDNFFSGLAVSSAPLPREPYARDD